MVKRTIWRLTKAKYAATALSGYGAMLSAGRWHPRGIPVVYAAQSAALALLETLVHVEKTSLLQFEYMAIPITLDEKWIEQLSAEELPDDWNAWPHPASTQMIGRRWFEEQRSVALETPSAVVPHESIYLLSPEHTAFSKLSIGEPEPFPIDNRLLP